MQGFEPQVDEYCIQKSVNNAFIATNLELHLKSKGIRSLMLAGLTSDHCVSTTARMAANLGFKVFILADCTATFDRKGPEASYPAELVHAVSLASLSGEFATIIKTIADFEFVS